MSVGDTIVQHRSNERHSPAQYLVCERHVDDHLSRDIRQFTSLPRFYLLSHWLEVPLHSIDPHPRCNRWVRTTLGCLVRTGMKHAAECHSRNTHTLATTWKTG